MIPQQTIGHYRITGKLGEGGMGAVYLATDTKLHRQVAIKVLPDRFADDPERLARFSREALVLASLNHPNIASIYGVEDRALIMELIEGRTLAELIQEGPIPLEESLSIAGQMVEALAYAHDKNVIHRDLKPTNIKVTSTGRVKVLDFGLAKALVSDSSAGNPAGDLSASPTLTIRSTETGIILGTAGYMSPEQARGKPVDKRADIWAFGVVLYEMVTRSRLFHRDTLSDVLAAVLKEEPDWERAPVETRRLLRCCLEKDPQRRLRDIGDAMLLVEGSASPAVARRLSRAPWIAAAAFALAAALAWWPGRAVHPPDRPLIRLTTDLGPGAMPGTMITAAISPDGTRIVFPWRTPDGAEMLATRRLDESKITPLAGTDGGFNQFFSPDSQWIGFFAANRLKKIPAQGGAAVILWTISNPRGATWGQDGSIITPLTNEDPLVRIPADGKQPQPVTRIEGEELTHRWPHILPGGRVVLFTGRSPSFNSYENASIDAVTLKTGVRKTVWTGGYAGMYLPTSGNRGHLVYIHEGSLFAVPFDPERLELEGTPAPIVEDIAADPTSGAPQFDVSQTGTLVYLPGVGKRRWPMVSLDAEGRTEPLLPKPAMYYSPRFSPDGGRLAFALEAGNGTDIYVYDFARQSTVRLTFSQQGNIEPVWAPDGKHILYRAIRPPGLWWVRANGGGEPQLLRQGNLDLQGCSFSPDGKRLAYQEMNAQNNHDIWILPLDLSDPDHPKPGTPAPLIATPASERYPAFSPDGRWIAYNSDESGVQEVYVRRVSEPGGKWQISSGGGLMPMWSRTGRNIFFKSPQERIWVAGYDVAGDTFLNQKPRLWSPVQIISPGNINLDLAPDGKHFAVFLSPEASAEKQGTLHVTFLLNFFDELRRRLPATGK